MRRVLTVQPITERIVLVSLLGNHSILINEQRFRCNEAELVVVLSSWIVCADIQDI